MGVAVLMMLVAVLMTAVVVPVRWLTMRGVVNRALGPRGFVPGL